MSITIQETGAKEKENRTPPPESELPLSLSLHDSREELREGKRMSPRALNIAADGITQESALKPCRA